MKLLQPFWVKYKLCFNVLSWTDAVNYLNTFLYFIETITIIYFVVIYYFSMLYVFFFRNSSDFFFFSKCF